MLSAFSVAKVHTNLQTRKRALNVTSHMCMLCRGAESMCLKQYSHCPLIERRAMVALAVELEYHLGVSHYGRQ